MSILTFKAKCKDECLTIGYHQHFHLVMACVYMCVCTLTEAHTCVSTYTYVHIYAEARVCCWISSFISQLIYYNKSVI